MPTSSESKFFFFLRQFLLTRKYLFIEELGELKLLCNGAVANKKKFSPPLFSLIWNDARQDSFHHNASEKVEELVEYIIKNADWDSVRVRNYIERTKKRLQHELSETSKFSIETIGDVHSTNGFFYVIAHPLIFPSFPRLTLSDVIIQPEDMEKVVNVALSSPTSHSYHEGGLQRTHPSSLTTKTTLLPSVTPSIIRTPTKTAISSTATEITKQVQPSKPYYTSPYKNPSSDKADETKVLEKYLFISVFVLSVVLIILYLVTASGTNTLGSLLR